MIDNLLAWLSEPVADFCAWWSALCLFTLAALAWHWGTYDRENDDRSE